MSNLERLGPEIWGAEHDLYMPGGIHFRGRMTVIRLSDGSLLLHSPIPIDDALADALAALGTVAHVVAPSRLHHLHVAGVQARYPEARVWGAPGLAEKRSDLAFDGVLTVDDTPWSAEFEPLFIEGIPWMNEVVFFHPTSRSLVVTDLFFNIHEVGNLVSRVFFSLYGVLGKTKQSPVVWLATRDRPAYRASLTRLWAWDFERAVPAHGRIVDDAPSVLASVLGTGGVRSIAATPPA